MRKYRQHIDECFAVYQQVMSNRFTPNYVVLVYHWQPHKPLFRKTRPSIIYELVYRGETRELY
jgi:hypothetical protein